MHFLLLADSLAWDGLVPSCQHLEWPPSLSTPQPHPWAPALPRYHWSILPSRAPLQWPPHIAPEPGWCQKCPYSNSPVAEMVLVLQPRVNPVPLKRESRVQDIGPPQTSQLHIISNAESSPRDLRLNAKTQLHSTTSKLQCCTPCVKQLVRQENNHTH